MRWIIITIVSLMVLFTVTAEPNLKPPHQYYGDVIINGNSASDDILIEGYIEGSSVASTKTENGDYSLKVADPYDNRQGETITFYVNGIETENTVVYDTSSTITKMDLDLDGVVVCGDGICDSSEGCNGCPTDCGVCDTGGGGSGGSSGSSGSGGGSYISTTSDDESEDSNESNDEDVSEVVFQDCDPDWYCSEWSACISGVQSRDCVDLNQCGQDDEKPDEKRDCEVPQELKSEAAREDTQLAADEPENPDSNTEKQDEYTQDEAMFLGGIISPQIGILITALVVIVGIVTVLIVRKSRN